ncbi:signal peptidase I [Virgibacillus halodenitrificans]|uniref:signal peptidase I n=1 Tax=Virgibacillus halodenitrificans TaxID=1482 RepID=UPI001F08F7E9|nr:signal peptidase I [Virgibacillus halodenitrificans]
MNEKLKKGLRELLDFGKSVLFFMVIVILLRVFVFATYDVSGSSMEPNFHDGERLIVSKLSYQVGIPERFDVVVFHATNQDDYIKRVIGLPGDEIKYENDILYVNGQPIEENFIKDEKKQSNHEYTENFNMKEILPHETVPEGYVFVMGDNRPNSVDSRYASLGFIPIESVVGEVIVRLFPLNQFNVGISGNQSLH